MSPYNSPGPHRPEASRTPITGLDDAEDWSHLSPEGQRAPTLVEAITEKVERRRAYKRANGIVDEPGRETLPFQISSRESGPRPGQAPPSVEELIRHAGSIKAAFPDLVSARPYCTDNLARGLVIRSKPIALRRRYLQIDSPKLVRWLKFDIDKPDAYFAAENANLPLPNFIALNPQNGHSLTAYLLAVPVRKFDGSRRQPMDYLAATERGLRRRLGADPYYGGLLAKNPTHPCWRVDWQMPRPYELGELADSIDRNDMRPEPKEETSGYSRNCDVFNDTRKWAYENVLDCKRAGHSRDHWERRLFQIAEGHNRIFNAPLGHADLLSIARSISRWTWSKFSEAEFSRIQSLRAQRRWAGHVAESATEPWKALGISRASYYRKKKAARL